MERPFRYGLFRFGQGWTFIDEDGARVSVADLDRAIATAAVVMAVHRAAGQPVELVVQDQDGGLITVLDPADQLAISKLPKTDHWDVFRTRQWQDLNAGNGRSRTSPRA